MRWWVWLGLAGCVAPTPERGVTWSDIGVYAITSSTTPSPPTVGWVQVELALADTDGAPSEGVTLRATPWMPDMNHGIDEDPEIVDQGGGAHTVSFEPTMPGLWELRLTLDGPAGRDEATLSFEVE